jgi:CRP-like cAMP-binding protein
MFKSVSEDESVSVNKLLTALPKAEYQRLAPHLEQVALSPKQVLYESGESMRAVYFPTSGMISLVSILEDGTTSEIGLVGREGIIGFPIFLGGNFTASHAVVQIAGGALRLEAELLKREFDRGQWLHRLLLLYTQALLTQVAQTALCNRQHALEQRLARWLLSVRDCVEQDQLALTQEFMASLLGISPTDITLTVNVLQQTGAIDSCWGQIAIRDRAALEARACECYDLVQNEYIRLFGFTHL